MSRPRRRQPAFVPRNPVSPKVPTESLVSWYFMRVTSAAGTPAYVLVRKLANGR